VEQAAQDNLHAKMHDLWLRAGRPSTRNLAAALGTISHTTIHEIVTGRRLVSWRKLEPLILKLGGDPAEVMELWRAAAWELEWSFEPTQEIHMRDAEIIAIAIRKGLSEIAAAIRETPTRRDDT
jgi:hypothetical protein